MSYAYLFKYIIIGDTGKQFFSSFILIIKHLSHGADRFVDNIKVIHTCCDGAFTLQILYWKIC